jgi:hypothetical protein
MSDLLALAERVEAATGPDWAINAEIEIAVKGFPQRAYDRQNGMRPRGTPAIDRLEFVRKGWASDYTGSIDSAMTLISEGWWLQHLGQKIGGWCCRVETNGPPSRSIASGFGRDERPVSAALALTAACLKARAASTPSLNAEIAGINQGDSA